MHWKMSVLAEKCFVVAHDGKCELEKVKYSDMLWNCDLMVNLPFYEHLNGMLICIVLQFKSDLRPFGLASVMDVRG